MSSLHVSLHVLPEQAARGPMLEIGGRLMPTLNVAPAYRCDPFPISFEEAADRLAALQRLHIEPDGSFVCSRSGSDQARWQIEGNLYDRGGRLLYVELRGSCTRPFFDQLRAAVGLHAEGFMVQLVRQAVFLGGREFVVQLPALHSFPSLGPFSRYRSPS